MSSSVLIVDNHQIVCSALKDLLLTIPGVDCVGTCHVGESALKMTDNISYELCVAEIELPDMSGIDLIGRIRAKSPRTRFLVSTMHDEVWVIDEIIRIGVEGMIMKNSDLATYHAFATAILAGKTCYCHRYELVKRELETRRDLVLSKTELRVLKLIFEGYSTREIAELLYRSANTIESHRRHIMAKMKVTNVVELINKAHLCGFSLICSSCE